MEEYRKIWERAPKVTGDDFVFSEEIWKKHYATYRILNNTFRSVPGLFTCGEDNEGPSKKQSFRDQLNAYKKKIKWEDQSGYRYLFAMHPDPKCPRSASLDIVEQEVYWYLRRKLSSKTGKAIVSPEENTLFNALHQKVIEEQPVYCKYVEYMWISQRKRCLIMHPDIKKFVNEAWKNRLSAVNNYPPKYCDFKMLPLVFAGDSKLVRALPAQNDSASLGIASRYIPPQTGVPLKLCTDYNEIQVLFPPKRFKSKVPVSRDKTAQEIACSCKPDVVISMSGLKCIMDNFNPEYDREWDIPIVVRDESPGVEGKGSKRVVYIDKPLPPKSMSAVDKNNWYNKYGVRALFCHVRNEELHRSVIPLPPEVLGEDNQAAGASKNQQRDKPECGESSGNEFTEQLSDEDDHWASDSSVEKLVIACSDDEQAAKMSHTMMKGKIQLQSKSSGVTKNATADSQSVTVSDVDVQKKIRTYSRKSNTDSKQDDNKSDSLSKSPGNKSDSPSKSPGNKSDSPSKNQGNKSDSPSKSQDNKSESPFKSLGNESDGASKTPGNKSDSPSQNPLKQENVNSAGTTGLGTPTEESTDDPCLMSNACVTYKLWKLMLEKDSQEETRANFLKSESSYRPILMLVRNNQDAVRIQNGVTSPVYLAAKQEYQAEYGMSMSAVSDTCRQWTSLYFRKKCALVRARIEAVSHEALLVEEKTIEEVAREWFDTRIRTTLLSILYSVLLGLQDLEPGNYLLSHRKKMGPFASLMKTTTRLSSIDLQTLYERVDVDSPEPTKDYPWSPVDCNLQTPSQHRRRRVPGLFPISLSSNIRNKPPTFTAKRTGPNMESNKKKKKNKKKKPRPQQ